MFSLSANIAQAAPPTITNITSSRLDGTVGVGGIIDINLTFSAAVTTTGDATVTLETGATDRTCTFNLPTLVSTASCNYTVQAGDISADLNVNTVAGTIKNAGLESMVNFTPATNLATNKALVIDTVPATITDVTSTKANGTYNSGEMINVTATFSKVVYSDFTRRTNAGSRN